MNFWCRILGHTWTPDTTSSDVHWHTTKKMDVLELQGTEDDVRYFDRCIRCDEQREVPRPAADERDAAARAAAPAEPLEAAADDAGEDEEDGAEDESAA